MRRGGAIYIDYRPTMRRGGAYCKLILDVFLCFSLFLEFVWYYRVFAKIHDFGQNVPGFTLFFDEIGVKP